jgi:predicted RNase H-like HicB family nuclease
MLIDYIDAAMHRAKYELLADDEGFVGQIPGFRGLIGHGDTLEECREDLYGALQFWLLLKLRHGDRDLPVVSGISLLSNKTKSKSRKKHPSKRAA